MMPTKELTNDIVKGIMVDAMVDRGRCEDVDTLVKPGVYIFDTNTKNLPNWSFQYGIAEVFIRFESIYQRITAYPGSMMAVRIGRPGDWIPWNFFKSTTSI